MELKKLKYRELDRMYVVIYTIKTPVQLEVEGRVRTRDMYTFIGITIEGKRRFLTYGIDVNYDTDFWMQQFKNISRRGTEKVLYITLGEEKGKRAAQLTFQGVKVMPDLFKLIDKTFPYFADTYKNKMPEEIKRLYTLETKEEITNKKNGHSSKGKKIKTSSGEITIDMPRDRKGTFDPVIISKRKRVTSDFSDFAILLYLKEILKVI